MRHHLLLTLGLSLAAVPAALEPPITAAARPPADIVQQPPAVRDGIPLTAYRARRVLTASTRGGRMRAALVAWTSLDPARGFEWGVIEEHGSGLIRNKVLKAALDTELRLALKGEAARGALTEDNYTFTTAGNTDEGQTRVGLRALRKDTLLLNGSLLLAADGDLVSVEGHLVKRPSFWTRKVWVMRDYGRVAGVRVPLRMTSRADVLMAGQSDFEMIYEYESVNGQPVDAPGQPVTVSASSE